MIARWLFSTFQWHTMIVLIMFIYIMRTKDRCVYYMNLFWLLFSVCILIISNTIWITVELGLNVLSQRWLFSLYFELQKSTRTILATIINYKLSTIFSHFQTKKLFKMFILRQTVFFLLLMTSILNILIVNCAPAEISTGYFFCKNNISINRICCWIYDVTLCE